MSRSQPSPWNSPLRTASLYGRAISYASGGVCRPNPLVDAEDLRRIPPCLDRRESVVVGVVVPRRQEGARRVNVAEHAARAELRDGRVELALRW